MKKEYLTDIELPIWACPQGTKQLTVISTSTRNFPNRLGKNTFVYLGSAELAAVCAKIGRIPTKEEYLAQTQVLAPSSADIYKYLNFDKISDYTKIADEVKA